MTCNFLLQTRPNPIVGASSSAYSEAGLQQRSQHRREKRAYKTAEAYASVVVVLPHRKQKTHSHVKHDLTGFDGHILHLWLYISGVSKQDTWIGFKVIWLAKSGERSTHSISTGARVALFESCVSESMHNTLKQTYTLQY